MKSTVVDESLSSFKPMYCSREYQASTRLIQQYEKSTLNAKLCILNFRGDVGTVYNIQLQRITITYVTYDTLVPNVDHAFGWPPFFFSL